MAGRISAQELLDGYEILFDTPLRLAHEAVMVAAAELSDDGWPTVPMLIRFAKCYGVPLEQLAGLCGILVSKIGRRTVFSDARRHPGLVNRLNVTMWSHRALVCYGFYNNASLLLARDQGTVH